MAEELEISKPKKNNTFNNIFEDSDDEYEAETDFIEAEVTHKYQEKYNNSMKKFKEFMNNPDYVTKSKDENTNIVDLCTMNTDKMIAKSYAIPEEKIGKMFKYMELCRRDNLHMMMYERQQENSGIMIDFDIFQKNPETFITKELTKTIAGILMMFFAKYLNLKKPDRPYENGFSHNYMAFIKKPEPKMVQGKNYYKDGFHVLIPSIKVTKEIKKFLIQKMVDDNIFVDLFDNLDIADGFTPNQFIDKNSSHVPVFFIGSSTKTGAPPYNLLSIIEFNIKEESLHNVTMSASYKEVSYRFLFGDKPPKEVKDQKNSEVVLCHELSLNWENKKNGIIKKYKFEINEIYAKELSFVERDLEHEIKTERAVGELSILNMHDPDTEYIEGLLNTLNPNRCSDFEQWFKVLCVLAHTNKSYKLLAEKFSMKCPSKYNPVDFEHHWNSACSDKKNKLNIGSLHFWAKQDNPEKYEAVRQNSIYSIVYRNVYDIQLEGLLQHYDVAKILYKSLRHKYAFDSTGRGIWYEFILDEDPKRGGEVFKWRAYNSPPNSLKKYTSEILPLLFAKVFDRIDVAIEGSPGDEKSKFHHMVKMNLKQTCRKIRDSNFKTGILRACEEVFDEINFTETLDKIPDVLGVGNGVLKLGGNIEFVTGYHNYRVSQHTPVNYMPFNPYDPTIKKLLYALRNMFPDEESDTFEFLMCYLASSLDGKKKESLFLILVGSGSNGKSWLMEMFAEAIGPYGAKMPLSFLTSRSKNAEGATPVLMMLRTARSARYSESNKNEELHLAKVKEFTGQETLGGRNLNEGFVNFKPTCHHIVATNNDFRINGNDHGTWRRIKRLAMRIKFCDDNDDYNPDNPFERLADPSMISQWTEDPNAKSAFLSVLCFYYERLQNVYGGLVKKVPHPHIQKDTEKYRDSEDKVNSFINSRIIKTAIDNKDNILTLGAIIAGYTNWHKRLYPDDKDYQKSISDNIQDSKLIEYFKTDRTGRFIVGYRILEEDEHPLEGEQFFTEANKRRNINAGDVITETADMFYKRICREYDDLKVDKDAAIKKAARELQKKRVAAAQPINTNVGTSKENSQVNTETKKEENYDKSGFKKSLGNVNSSSFSNAELDDFACGDSESESE